MKEQLQDYEYNTETVQKKTEQLTEQILTKLADQKLPYKICTSVTITEKAGSGCHNACSSYYDKDQDGMSLQKFDNATIFCVVNCFFCSL